MHIHLQMKQRTHCLRKEGWTEKQILFFLHLGEILPRSKTNSIVSKGKPEQKKKNNMRRCLETSCSYRNVCWQVKKCPISPAWDWSLYPTGNYPLPADTLRPSLGFEGEILSAGLWESRRRHRMYLHTSKTSRELNWKTLHSPAWRQQNRRLNTTV